MYVRSMQFMFFLGAEVVAKNVYITVVTIGADRWIELIRMWIKNLLKYETHA